MGAEREVQVSESQIAVHWREEDYNYPPAKFIAQASAADPAIFDRFGEDHFPDCFKEYAELLTWDAYWHTTLDTSNPPFWKWFVGGRFHRQLQLRGRPPHDKPEQGSLHLGAGARGPGDQGHHLPGAVPAGERVRRAPPG